MDGWIVVLIAAKTPLHDVGSVGVPVLFTWSILGSVSVARLVQLVGRGIWSTVLLLESRFLAQDSIDGVVDQGSGFFVSRFDA